MQVKDWLIKGGVALALLASAQLADARGHGTHHRTYKIHLAAKATGSHQSLQRTAHRHKEVGIASFYHDRFHGRRTASGEIYDRNAMTTQHAHLPFGTILKVTNLHNHRTVHVKVNDRGGHMGKRILDLSHKAARELGFTAKGLAMVKVEIVSQPSFPG
ncbi:MAG: hypothetical protein RIQ52_75 [Pseudomonadota bacterium]|jgi:rare lipoprotein A